MFWVETENGRYRYYEKYWNDSVNDWRQVSCTLDSESRQAQGEARRRLAKKIEKKKSEVVSSISVMALYEDWQLLRKQELKESTFITQRHDLSSFLREYGKVDVHRITTKELQRFILTKPWSVSYKKTVKSILNVFFKYCIKMKVIKENPVADVILPKNTKTIEDIKKAESKFYNRKEMRIYMKFVRAFGYSERMNLRIEFMYLTGLRYGEASALSEDDCNLSKLYFDVNATLTNRNKRKEYKRTAPKTLRSYRRIMINNRCVDIIKRLIELNRPFKRMNPDKLIFLNEQGLPMNLFTFNNYLKKFAEKAKLRTDVVFTSHVLRHSHVCLLAEMGVSQKVIMDRMGHGDEKVTLRIYTHVTKQMVVDLSDKLESVTV